MVKSMFTEAEKLTRKLYGFNEKINKKKRVKLTPGDRLYIWEHPKMYGRTCNICGERITKMSEMELDHTHPYSKGGTKMNLTHRDCNRRKGSKSLKQVQKKMILKKPTKKKLISKKPKKKKTATSSFDIKIPKIKIPRI